MKLESTRRYTQGARARAAEATGERIVSAFLSQLMGHWYDDITLARVAEQAGVTVQTVVRRFGDKESLLAEAVRTFADQVNRRRACQPGRVGEAVSRLLEDYEAVGDGVIRLLALESRYPVLAEVLNFGRAEHRRWVAEAFGPLLPDPDCRSALDGLVVLTDVYTWKLLRRDLGRSAQEYQALVTDLIDSSLKKYGGNPG